MATGLQLLRNLSKVKTDITKITREDFSSNELRAKYFRAYNRSLDRLHLPVMTKEVYEPIAQEEFNNPRMDKANLKFETASSYYIRKAQLFVLACDLGVNPKTLDSSNYIWDEDYYIHSNFLINIDIAEELYRENEDDWRTYTGNDVYIKQDPKSSTVDKNTWNTLYKFCVNAISSRRAMLLSKVPQCLSFLMSIAEYTNGFAENATRAQSATLNSYLEFFAEMVKDEEAVAFIQSTNDIEMFAKNESTAKDYVETYRSMLRQLIRGTGEDLGYFKSYLTAARPDIEDPFIDELTAIDLDPEDFLSGNYLENEDGNEDFEHVEV